MRIRFAAAEPDPLLFARKDNNIAAEVSMQTENYKYITACSTSTLCDSIIPPSGLQIKTVLTDQLLPVLRMRERYLFEGSSCLHAYIMPPRRSPAQAFRLVFCRFKLSAGIYKN